jgi:HEAT repeat protein
MSIDALIETIRTQSPLKAVLAIHEISKLGDERAIDILVEVLYAGNIMTQQAAAEALTVFQHERVITALCQALTEGSALVRLQVIKSLETMNRPETIPCLMKALQDAEAESLQYTIIEALGNMKALQALELIQQYVSHPNHHVRKRAHIAVDKIMAARADS